MYYIRIWLKSIVNTESLKREKGYQRCIIGQAWWFEGW